MLDYFNMTVKTIFSNVKESNQILNLNGIFET